MSIDIAIALNRFGYGIRPEMRLPRDARRHLLNQLYQYDAIPSTLRQQPTVGKIARLNGKFRDASRAMRRQRKKAQSEDAEMPPALEKARKDARGRLRDIYIDAVNARVHTAVLSEQAFTERLVHFWSNHFAISVDKREALPYAGDHEFHAIRPHIMGKFSDLLMAAVTHPAMLLYLDQAISVGPGSQLAQRVNRRRRARPLGLNENLAREVLELHTLGDKSVYSQSDVTELAKALTGTTVSGIVRGPLGRRISRLGPKGETVFFEAANEPGGRTILGRHYPAAGAAQLESIFSDLAKHESTARNIAVKLARHFVSDNPPASLVKRLQKDFLRSGGDLSSLYKILIESPESWPKSWDVSQAKFKSPWDWAISSMRALDMEGLPWRKQNMVLLRQLAQPVWQPGSPAGFPDNRAQWAGSAALMRRFEQALRFSRLTGSGTDARLVAPQLLPATLGEHTMDAIANAEGPAQGVALLLVSPEFLRR